MSIKNKLPVLEIFSSIQGEGYFSGKNVTFLRLSGCDVGCPWCDTKESWTIKKNQYMTIDEILDLVKLYNNNNIVITGGEPMIWNLDNLTLELKKNNFCINLETSGAYDLTGEFDWICLSPKKFKPGSKNLKNPKGMLAKKKMTSEVEKIQNLTKNLKKLIKK